MLQPIISEIPFVPSFYNLSANITISFQFAILFCTKFTIYHRYLTQKCKDAKHTIVTLTISFVSVCPPAIFASSLARVYRQDCILVTPLTPKLIISRLAKILPTPVVAPVVAPSVALTLSNNVSRHKPETSRPLRKISRPLVNVSRPATILAFFLAARRLRRFACKECVSLRRRAPWCHLWCDYWCDYWCDLTPKNSY